MSAAVENPYAGQGSVLLDIGGDVGALVVTMPAEMEGVEVDIRPVDAQHPHPGDGHHVHHPHVAVVNRPVVDGQLSSLVYPEVLEGSYALHLKHTDEPRLTVRVRGGEVTSAEWPSEQVVKS